MLMKHPLSLVTLVGMGEQLFSKLIAFCCTEELPYSELSKYNVFVMDAEFTKIDSNKGTDLALATVRKNNPQDRL